jgi:ribosome-binding protein aMBF1 (putative translation factor)
MHNENPKKSFLDLVSTSKSNLVSTLQWEADNSNWLDVAAKIAMRVLDEMENRKLSRFDLAGLTGLSQGTIDELLKARHNLTLEQLSKLESALEIKLLDSEIRASER